MQLPEDHPLRQELHNEVHARPPVPLRIPSRLSFLALLSEPANILAEREHLSALCVRYGAPPPLASAKYYLGDLGAFRLKSERHAEFTRYTVITEGATDDPFSDPPINLLPPEWIAGLKGRTLVSATVAVLPFPENLDYGELSRRHFAGNTLIGSTVGQGAAIALTDLRIQYDGSSRLLIHDNHLTQRQAGRMVQRLLEIDTYRMMALLALPVAQGLNPFLAASERELAEITTLMHDGPREEPALLERLTKLQAA